MLLDNLRAEGYDVEVVTSAEDALMLPVDEYHLIISEIDLPGEIDGYDLLERLKEDRLTAGVPLIFCTSRDSENDVIKGLNLGADDFISRPFSLREMMARVRSVLRQAPQHESYSQQPHHRIPHADTQRRLARTAHRRRGCVTLSHRVRHTHSADALAQQTLQARGDICSGMARRTARQSPSGRREYLAPGKKLSTYAKNLVNKSGLGYGFVDKV